MGPYLSEPNKTKYTEAGESNWLKYAASSMQGSLIIFIFFI